jgi:recombination protein RecA
MPKKTEGPGAAALGRFMDGFTKRHEEVNIRDTSGPGPEFASTGSLALDYAMGGGFVKGRVSELWGPEQTGKSTLLTWSVAEYQRQHPKRMVGWIDAENTFDLDWARAHGVSLDSNRFLLVQPNNAEETADLVKELINAKDGNEPMFGPIVLDSVGAMIPQQEKDKAADEATMALVAKTVTRMVKIAAADLNQTAGMLWIINQVRANLSYGGDITRTGGFALSHVTTHRLKFRRADKPIMIGGKGEEEQVGQKLAVLIEKNKVAPPRRTAEMTFYNQVTEKYGPVGLDVPFDVFATAKRAGVFGRRGAWYDLPDGSEHNGEAAVLAYLRENPAAVDPIREKTLATKAHEVVTNPLEEG